MLRSDVLDFDEYNIVGQPLLQPKTEVNTKVLSVGIPFLRKDAQNGLVAFLGTRSLKTLGNTGLYEAHDVHPIPLVDVLDPAVLHSYLHSANRLLRNDQPFEALSALSKISTNLGKVPTAGPDPDAPQIIKL